MAKKVVTHKRHVNSLEAPQNNKDNNPVQNSRVLHRGAAKIGNNLSERKRNASSPGVVARLMGVDMLPSHNTKPDQKQVEKKHEPHVAKNDSISHLKRSSKSPRQKRSVSFDSTVESKVLDQWSYDGFGRREHPQEKELQKFKKEFEGWKVLEPKKCSLETSCHEKVGLQSKRFTAHENENVDIEFSERLAKLNLAPSNIVILRPGPDSIGLYSPRRSRESTSIEDFLEEVKGRLKCEMMDKKTCKKTTCNENPSDPKQIAQRIAKHVRESVTRDLGMNLFRSESTRSYRSDLHINETDASKITSNDSGRFLVERLKNVLKETHQHEPILLESKRSPKDISESKGKLKMQNSRSIREDEIQSSSSSSSSSSTRNLIRSLSAPVSGTSFGKLLLEDRHLHTGAHIRRKHESTEKSTSNNLNQKKKDKFNLKEKVTTFKQSITHKGKLFGKKSQSSNEEHEITEDISNRSSMTDFYDQTEDCTELPPSPASTASFISKSISDVASSDDNSKTYMNLQELRGQLNESDTDVSKVVMIDELPLDDLHEIEDQDESYIRDLLLVSGLYDGSIHQNSSTCEPITIQVFEEVEESLKHKTNNDQFERLKHKILFDLVNQTLPNLLEPDTTSPITRMPVHGKKLLDQIWKIIGVYVDHERESGQLSVDSMLDNDMKCSLWYTLMDDDVNVIGKDIECQIIRELIDEIVKGMMFTRRRKRIRRKG